jgi:hypothetical protein
MNSSVLCEMKLKLLDLPRDIELFKQELFEDFEMFEKWFDMFEEMLEFKLFLCVLFEEFTDLPRDFSKNAWNFEIYHVKWSCFCLKCSKNLWRDWCFMKNSSNSSWNCVCFIKKWFNFTRNDSWKCWIAYDFIINCWRINSIFKCLWMFY